MVRSCPLIHRHFMPYTEAMRSVVVEPDGYTTCASNAVHERYSVWWVPYPLCLAGGEVWLTDSFRVPFLITDG